MASYEEVPVLSRTDSPNWESLFALFLLVVVLVISDKIMLVSVLC